MFDSIVTALEPYALGLVVIAGLIMTGRVQVSDNVIVGIVLTFIGVALIIVHVIKSYRTSKQLKQGK